MSTVKVIEIKNPHQVILTILENKIKELFRKKIYRELIKILKININPDILLDILFLSVIKNLDSSDDEIVCDYLIYSWNIGVYDPIFLKIFKKLDDIWKNKNLSQVIKDFFEILEIYYLVVSCLFNIFEEKANDEEMEEFERFIEESKNNLFSMIYSPEVLLEQIEYFNSQEKPKTFGIETDIWSEAFCMGVYEEEDDDDEDYYEGNEDRAIFLFNLIIELTLLLERLSKEKDRLNFAFLIFCLLVLYKYWDIELPFDIEPDTRKRENNYIF